MLTVMLYLRLASQGTERGVCRYRNILSVSRAWKEKGI